MYEACADAADPKDKDGDDQHESRERGLFEVYLLLSLCGLAHFFYLNLSNAATSVFSFLSFEGSTIRPRTSPEVFVWTGTVRTVLTTEGLAVELTSATLADSAGSEADLVTGFLLHTR